MTKKEFLHELQIALQGEMDQAAVNENLRFYDNYIMEESRKGKSEAEVTAQLGNPRLIAKTLIDTSDKPGAFGKQYYSENYSSKGEDRGFRADYSEQDGWDVRLGGFKLNSWYGKLLLILIAILLIVIIANVVAFLLPVMVPIILIWLLYSLFFGNRR
ncbi:MAG: DUF1700 domain-containing protein [Lachnospiraceae bacterium]|nr:DUF1700 domain-containing protein [Lachnospiraceae bacterium]